MTNKNPYMDASIDARLLRAIFGAAREHGISSEELHDSTSIGFGKTSLKTLTRREAYQLLDGIRGRVQPGTSGVKGPRRYAMASHGRRGHDHSADPVYLVNERELQMLRDAASRRGWNEESLRKFCQRQIKKDAPQTMSELNKVFQPLKAMNRREGIDQ